jgi:hypothetical protein
MKLIWYKQRMERDCYEKRRVLFSGTGNTLKPAKENGQ